MFNSGCNVYCLSIKQAISSSLTSGSYTVTPEMVNIYQASRRRLGGSSDGSDGSGSGSAISIYSASDSDSDSDSSDGSSRRLSTTVTVGFTVTVYTSSSTASSMVNTLLNSFSSGSFQQTLVSYATSNNAPGLQSISITSYSASVSSSGSTKPASKNVAVSEGFIVMYCMIAMIPVLMYTLSALNRSRSTLFISGITSNITVEDLKQVLPG